MKKINLILGIHNHQPVGNFDFVFDEAYRKAYRPFLDVLSQFPAVKVGMHFTGIIFDWIDRTYPEFISDLRVLVERGQIEMIGGGFYEPILSVISDEDKAGQIRKLSRYVEEKTGTRPTGMWIAERVWEPHLPKPIYHAEMRYVILDDTHFQYAGLEAKDLNGYYVTEEEGYRIRVFPISKKLRYTIPFQEPEKTIAHLRSLAREDGQALAVFADDGEKFGIWPQTHKHVYEEKWLEKFFTLLVKNRDWIDSIHFSDAMNRLKPLGTVYLPASSYSEMQHWALPIDGFRAYETFENKLKENALFDTYGVFVRGGFWRNFLVKYPEANRMHKKMMRLSRRFQLIKAAGMADTDPDGEEKLRMLESAQDHIWASQCNCPYWHGVFGGIYLNNIRYAIYKEMLIAENFLDVLEYADRTNWIHYERTDYDADGSEEILIETKGLNLYLDPERGGGLFELDYKDVPMNMSDTLTRREEGYHKKLIDWRDTAVSEQGKKQDAIASIHDRILTKEKNLDEFLLYDRYLRQSFIDHFIDDGVSLDRFYKADFDVNGDFIGAPYTGEDRSDAGRVSVCCVREGAAGGSRMRVQKTYGLIPGASELSVHYEISNVGKKNAEIRFGPELNFTMLAGRAKDRYYYFADQQPEDTTLASKGVCENVSEMGMTDGWQSIRLRLMWDRTATVWRFPVETVSLSEEGFERVYQNSCVFPHWRLLLKPKASWSVNITLTLTRQI